MTRAARLVGPLRGAIVGFLLVAGLAGCGDTTASDDDREVYCAAANNREPVKKTGDAPCALYPDSRLETLRQTLVEMEWNHPETWKVEGGCADPTYAAVDAVNNKVFVHIGTLSEVTRAEVEDKIAKDPRYELEMLLFEDPQRARCEPPRG